MENGVYLLLGSNLGDREEILREATAKIRMLVGPVTQYSPVYQSKPWGNSRQPDFLNQAICISTDYSPEMLLEQILSIEESMGRTREGLWSPRTLDIDILFYGSHVILKPNLAIPHPEIANRRFCLTPLCDIAAGVTHPLLNKTVSELLAECPDPLPVEIYLTGS